MQNDYTSPLAPCCILVALSSEIGSKQTPLQRFAVGQECDVSSTEWRRSQPCFRSLTKGFRLRFSAFR